MAPNYVSTIVNGGVTAHVILVISTKDAAYVFATCIVFNVG